MLLLDCGIQVRDGVNTDYASIIVAEVLPLDHINIKYDTQIKGMLHRQQQRETSTWWKIVSHLPPIGL